MLKQPEGYGTVATTKTTSAEPQTKIRRPSMTSSLRLPLLCLLWPSVAFTFNLDLDAAVFRLGPPGSWFGFSLAAHFRQQGPSLLVGAPKAESGQPGTFQAGAVFACEPGLGHHQRLARDCGPPLAIEYPSGSGEAKRVPERPLHREGKNQQLLGFSVHSSGLRESTASRALACAPLLRWGQSAYTDGVCYLLGADLNHTGVLNPCETLPKKDRHNDYGACEQGFSAYLDNKVILTGLPGARKWTGGVFAKYDFLDSDGLLDTVDRRTMEVDKDQGGILALLASHDYLGYSVLYGHFGFWHEEENRNFTVVSGATRFNQTGAVLFLPFRRNFQAEDQRQLGITEDHFLLTGRQLGSGFGSSLAVLDLNADGFDDLVVGAPFEYANGADKEELGGAVYVFYSRGARQPRGASHLVFLEPIVLRGRSAHSQFGAALSRLGNLDNDPHGFQDFCVGAPQADRGRGEIFIFHGGQRSDFSTEPTQRIQAADLRSPRPLLGFGFSLAGGVDLDGDGYAELAVGAPGADAAVLFPAKPVLDVRLDHRFGQKNVKIEWEGSRKCAQGQSCFSLTTSLLILDRNQSALVLARAFPGGHQAPFLCRLEVLPFGRGIPLRAMLSASGGTQTSWTCGSPQAIGRPEERTFQLHIPKGNQDWTSPLRFNFSLTERRPSGGGGPALNPAQKFHIFDIAFDKDCGEDNECHTDLALSGTLLDLSRRGDGLYQAKVTERDALVLRLQVENRAESAFLAKLFLRYDETELDEPRLVRPKIGGQQQQMPLDVERREKGLAVVALGNPLKAGHKLSFDLLFKLVRGSSERISTSLRFEAQVNSSSFEQRAEDNRWEAEVQLIKEADLQLAGTSRPPITHFSRGNAQPIDELDIGTQVVHAFTLTNRGPFYARNISVVIKWPLQLHSGDWLLYTLEEPLIRHNGHFRRCGQPKAGGAVNPLGVYNDETLKLDYPAMVRPRKPRQTASGEEKEENVAEVEEEVPTIRTASILGGPLLPKSVRESSGEWVRVVDINCKDGTAQCVQLDCHFDYIGANDSALIEVRARLWNWTFSAAEDYRTFDYVAITSEAFIEVDPAQGILEDVSNNFAQVTSHAYPDRPQQEDRIELWLLLLAVLIGLLLLAILVLSCWLFGFFRRKRPDLHLHQAYYQREREESVLAQ